MPTTQPATQVDLQNMQTNKSYLITSTSTSRTQQLSTSILPFTMHRPRSHPHPRVHTRTKTSPASVGCCSCCMSAERGYAACRDSMLQHETADLLSRSQQQNNRGQQHHRGIKELHEQGGSSNAPRSSRNGQTLMVAPARWDHEGKNNKMCAPYYRMQSSVTETP